MSKKSKVRNKKRRIAKLLSPSLVVECQPIEAASIHGTFYYPGQRREVYVLGSTRERFGLAFDLIDSLISRGVEFP